MFRVERRLWSDTKPEKDISSSLDWIKEQDSFRGRDTSRLNESISSLNESSVWKKNRTLSPNLAPTLDTILQDERAGLNPEKNAGSSQSMDPITDLFNFQRCSENTLLEQLVNNACLPLEPGLYFQPGFSQQSISNQESVLSPEDFLSPDPDLFPEYPKPQLSSVSGCVDRHGEDTYFQPCLNRDDVSCRFGLVLSQLGQHLTLSSQSSHIRYLLALTVILSYPPFTVWHVTFTTVPFKTDQ